MSHYITESRHEHQCHWERDMTDPYTGLVFRYRVVYDELGTVAD